MKIFLGALLLAAIPATPAFAQACTPGTYAAPDGDFVVMVKSPAVPEPGLRYLFRDGRRGATSDAATPFVCGSDTVTVHGKAWKPIAFRETPATFDSVATKMNGVLIEPPGGARREAAACRHGARLRTHLADRRRLWLCDGGAGDFGLRL